MKSFHIHAGRDPGGMRKNMSFQRWRFFYSSINVVLHFFFSDLRKTSRLKDETHPHAHIHTSGSVLWIRPPAGKRLKEELVLLCWANDDCSL